MGEYLGTSLTASMEAERLSMFLLSQALLKALWREHPDKLARAIANGRNVERPN